MACLLLQLTLHGSGGLSEELAMLEIPELHNSTEITIVLLLSAPNSPSCISYNSRQGLPAASAKAPNACLHAACAAV